MAIKISLDGVNVSGNSKLLTNSTIKSHNVEVDINLKDTTMTDSSTFLDSTQIEETQSQYSNPQNKENGKSKLATGVGSFVRDVIVNLVSDGIKGKL